MRRIPEEGARTRLSEGSDAFLVEGARRGEAEAFEALVHRYLPIAHRAARFIVGSPDLADDVCQDAFISALRKLDQCRQPERFRGWLLTIVRNRALNLRASENLRSGASLESAAHVPSPGDPSEALEAKEAWAALNQASEDLTGLKKDVYLLHEIEGMTHGEIAKTLGITSGASRVHLHMARKRMKKSLAGLDLKEAL